MNKARTAQHFKKKPVVIEAIYWDGGNWNEVCDFLDVPKNGRGDQENMSLMSPDGPDRLPILIHTLEGDMRAEIGDWIIKGVAGEYYPCKNPIFQATYEPATAEGVDG